MIAKVHYIFLTNENKMKPCHKVLICSATKGELKGIKNLDVEKLAIGLPYPYEDGIDILITGVGYFSTIYYLTKTILLHEYCLVFAVGIAGDYRLEQPVPQLYVINHAQFADTGFENAEGGFTPLVGSPFLQGDTPPFSGTSLKSRFAKQFAQMFNLALCNVNTVNRTCTNTLYISELLKQFPAEIETMESAALHYVALLENIPLIEIRATSNHVTPKQIEKWQIAKAVEKLTNFVNNNIHNTKIYEFKRIIYCA